MLFDDKKLLYLIGTLKEEREDYDTAEQVEIKAMQHGYKIFTEKGLLTDKEQAVFDKAMKKINKV